MKNQWKKWKESRRLKLFLIMTGVYLALLIVVSQNSFWYTQPIVKIKKVNTIADGYMRGARGQKEKKYRQQLEGTVVNGKYKGKKVHLFNSYAQSLESSERYRRGDKLFVDLSVGKNSLQGTVRGMKRDTLLFALVGGAFLVLFLVTGGDGIRTSVTVLINCGVYIAGFLLYLKGINLLFLCHGIVIISTITTLLLLHGCHVKTWVAIISSLCVVELIILLYNGMAKGLGDLDYSSMEYLGSIDNPDEFFRAGLLFAGLGAIMDVAVTITSALTEVHSQHKNATFLQLYQSGKEVGYDIMGTMINVLLFTYVGGLLPEFILQMNNDIRFFAIIKLHIPYEIGRFLVESIGIVLTIPVTILLMAGWFALGRRRSHA